MKKLFVLLALISVFSLVLLGCNKNEELNDELEREILEDFLITSALIGDVSPEDINYTCFGQFGDSVAIYFHTAGAYKTPVEEEVAGYTFSYPDSRVIKIWNNGKFYKMGEAYELGLIDYFDILSIKIESLFLKSEEPYFVYEEKDIESVPSNIYTQPELYYLDQLKVFIDPGLCKNDYSITLGFFNNHELIKSIERLESNYEYYGTRFEIYLYSNTVEELISVKEYIEQIDGVRRVELIGGWELAAHTNDTYFLSEDLWGINSINLDRVWDFVIGSDNIYVGVMDTGVAFHEDLNSNLLIGKDFPNNDFITNDDILGHGTHVAGIIGAVGNNGIGVVGVNWKVGIIPLQVRNEYLPINGNDIVSAIEHSIQSLSTNQPIRILSVSIAGSRYDQDMHDAIADYSGLIVCAAGQNNQNIDEYPVYPAFYGSKEERNVDRVDNIIVVGAIDKNDNIAYIDTVLRSNYGDNTVDIYAPGREIYSTGISNTYISDSGTSFATPYVSGVAALLLSVNPDLTTAQLKDCILNGAEIITIYAGENYDTPQEVKKLDAWGSFMYLMEKYYPLYSCEPMIEPIELSCNIDADASYMKDHTAMIKLDLKHSGNFDFSVSASSPIDVILYDEDLNVVNTTQTVLNNGNRIDFSQNIQGVHYLRINYQNSTAQGTVNVSIDCPATGHVYNAGYQKFSPKKHQLLCACGNAGPTAPHAIKYSDVGNTTASCILCGQLIDLRDTIVEVPWLSIQKVTVNGSYILPNGIIVLVDSDIESYLNGTLVFYDKDDLPVVQ